MANYLDIDTAIEASRALGQGFLDAGRHVVTLNPDLLRLLVRLLFLKTVEARHILPDGTIQLSTWDDFRNTLAKLVTHPRLKGYEWEEPVRDLLDRPMDEDCYAQALAALASNDLVGLDVVETGEVFSGLYDYYARTEKDSYIVDYVHTGSDRKTSGAYFTPYSLVLELLRTALDPVLEQKKAEYKDDPACGLLSTTVCDPACGAGVFLVMAARRIAENLVQIYDKDEDPWIALRKLPSYRRALREAVASCLYGMDLNPVTVDVCRMVLWLECADPGQYIHISARRVVCANPLLGTTWEAIAKGIPDDACKPLAGDDKQACAKLQKANKEFRKSLLFKEFQEKCREMEAACKEACKTIFADRRGTND